MTILDKRQFLFDYCNGRPCNKCKLKDYSWTYKKPAGCLDRYESPENDLDHAIAIITGVVDEEDDPVNHPQHYADGKIEVIDFIVDKKLGFCLGNAVKYIARAGKKDPTKEVEDLKKAIWYIEYKIKQLEEVKV